jgi:hypothetical protein
MLALVFWLAFTATASALNWDVVFNRLPLSHHTDHTYGSFRNCGSSSDTAKNLVISITPDSPKGGQEVTTIFKYDLSKEVTSGKASYGFTFNGIPFSPTVDELCADQAGGCCPDPCPLAVGAHENKSLSNFPEGVSGKIVTTIKWTDQDNAQILCVEWTVRA